MTEKERNLLYGVVSLILPGNILDQFDIVRLEDEDYQGKRGGFAQLLRDLCHQRIG